MTTEHTLITQAMQNWVKNVIVKFNFCPFARKEVEANTIAYIVSEDEKHEDAVMTMLEQLAHLDAHPEVETTLLIFAEGFKDFDSYLDLVDLANALLAAQGYEGKYQIAHFHPDYEFADSEPGDAANYTNRAPYPTLHLIREESMAEALANYDDPESIPENNIRLARRKGEAFWQQLLANCHKS